MPELFPLLRYLADTMEHTTFVVLGSASPDIVAATAESLAGRVAFHDLAPFDIGETSAISWRTHWLRGGYPRALLADSDKAARLWLDDYIRTFLERDIPQLGTAYGMEFKYTDAPMMTRSMKTTLDDLHLARLWVVYPGDQTYPLDDRITVVPLSRIGEIVLP
jgi:hypothetical protein